MRSPPPIGGRRVAHTVAPQATAAIGKQRTTPPQGRSSIFSPTVGNPFPSPPNVTGVLLRDPADELEYFRPSYPGVLVSHSPRYSVSSHHKWGRRCLADHRRISDPGPTHADWEMSNLSPCLNCKSSRTYLLQSPTAVTQWVVCTTTSWKSTKGGRVGPDGKSFLHNNHRSGAAPAALWRWFSYDVWEMSLILYPLPVFKLQLLQRTPTTMHWQVMGSVLSDKLEVNRTEGRRVGPDGTLNHRTNAALPPPHGDVTTYDIWEMLLSSGS